MLSDPSHRLIQAYWEWHLGCAPGSLFAEPIRVMVHGGELADYGGVFALFRGGRVILSSPGEIDDLDFAWVPPGRPRWRQRPQLGLQPDPGAAEECRTLPYDQASGRRVRPPDRRSLVRLEQGDWPQQEELRQARQMHRMALQMEQGRLMRLAFKKWIWHFDQGNTPDTLVDKLNPLAEAVIGPAFIGYAETVPAADPAHQARSLSPSDAAAVESLQAGCDPTEWAHGGSPLDHVCSGAFESGELAALAGYEVWGGTIAHISVVTHPEFRGRGHGRTAVAHVAQRALGVGLLPQYRTLESNAPSMRIAESLGFEKYAASVAVRF